MTIVTATVITTTAVVLRAVRQADHFARSRCSARRPWMPCPCLSGLFHSNTATHTQILTLQQQKHEQEIRTIQQQNTTLQHRIGTLRLQHDSEIQQLVIALRQLQHQIRATTQIHGNFAYHLRTLRPGTTVTRAEDIPIPDSHTPWEID